MPQPPGLGPPAAGPQHCPREVGGSAAPTRASSWKPFHRRQHVFQWGEATFLELTTHQLPPNYSGCTRQPSIPPHPHTRVQGWGALPGMSSVWLAQCGDSALTTTPRANFSSAESEWPACFGGGTAHGSRGVTQSHCCHCSGLGRAVLVPGTSSGDSKGTSGGAAYSALALLQGPGPGREKQHRLQKI